MFARKLVVYVSASDHDLGSVRSHLAPTLKKLGATPVENACQGLPDAERLQAILQGIATSHAVLHIAGCASGAMPPVAVLGEVLAKWDLAAPGFSNRLGLRPGEPISYAQLEARMAYALGKPIHPIVLAETYLYDAPVAESMQSNRMQKVHRATLSGVTPVTTEPRSLTELKAAVRKLGIPGAPPQVPSNRRPAVIAAGAVLLSLLLGVGSWWGWTHHRSSTASGRPLPPGDVLAFQLAENTLPRAMAGVITTADQRFADAEKSLALKEGVSSAELHEFLGKWASSVEAKADAGNYEQALALFFKKDYAGAERYALRAVPDLKMPEVLTGPDEMRLALQLAVRAQFAQFHYADAEKTNWRDKPQPHGDARENSLAQMREYFVNGLLGAYARGAANACHNWEYLCDKMERKEKGVEFTPDECLVIKSWVAAGRAAQGRCEEALSMARGLPHEYENLHGWRSYEVKHSLALLASVLTSGGHFAEAAAELEKSNTLQIDPYWPDDPNATQNPMLGAQLSLARGNVPQALSHAQNVATERSRVFGAENPNTAEALSHLGVVLQAQGNFTGAEAKQQEAIAIMSRCGDDNVLPMIVMKRRLAMVRFDEGHLQEAEDSLYALVRAHTAIVTGDNPSLSETENCLATVLSDTGYLNLAGPMAKKALERVQKIAGLRAPQLVEINNNLACMFLRSGHADAAEEFLRQAYNLLDQNDCGNSLSMAHCLELYGDYMGLCNRRAEEEAMVKRVQSIYQDDSVMTHPVYGMCLHDLGCCRSGDGKIEEALNLHDEADKVFKAALPAGHWRFAWGEFLRAHSLQKAGRDDEAIALGNKAVQDYQKSLPGETPRSISMKKDIAGWAVEKQLRAIRPKPGETKEEYLERLRKMKGEAEALDPKNQT